MSENGGEKLAHLLEEYDTNKGLRAEEHIILLRQVENFPREEAIIALNCFLEKETEPQVLLHLVKTVSKYNCPSSIGVLTELLLWKEKFKSIEKKPEDYLKVRLAAASALKKTRDNKAVLPLLYVLNNKDENYKLRLNCAEALGSIGNNYAVAPLIDVVSDEEEKSVYVRESAAKALGQLGDIRAIDPLVSILETKKGLIDKFTFLKERVIESLGRIGLKDDKTLQVLKNALMDESPYIRLGAVEALSEIDDHRVIPLIEKMIQDEEEDVARGAINALYNLNGIDYITPLLERDDIAGWCKDEIQCIIEELEEESQETEENEQ